MLSLILEMGALFVLMRFALATKEPVACACAYGGTALVLHLLFGRPLFFAVIAAGMSCVFATIYFCLLTHLRGNRPAWWAVLFVGALLAVL